VALWVTSATFTCKAAAAIQASANVIGRHFFSEALFGPSPLASRFGVGQQSRQAVRKRPIKSRRLAPNSSLPYVLDFGQLDQ
jgi:hypothetical protein